MKRFYFFLISISFHLFLSAQSTEVGSTPGELSVSLSGAANYTIPIAVPPGINGIVPQINICYSSQAGNGVAGYGWNIGGLSTIGRIASTKFHDGIIDPVDFDNLDRFAFNGQRLIVKNGTAGIYGANNTIYETENFSNVKISSFGVHPNGASYGPAYFLVEYPDGSKAYYGNSSDSRSLTDWAITYWESAQGVRISYNYTQSNNVLDIASIKYGTLTTTAPINEINFNYDARLRPEQAYIGGESFTKTKKLLNINVLGNGIGYRNYYFDYKTTSENYQQLDHITEKSGDLSKSYNPISFEYGMSSETILPKASTSQTALGNINSLNSAVVSGDFDGDAKMDFILYPTTGINAKKDFWLFTNVGKNSLVVPSKISCGYFSAIFASTGLTSNNKQYYSQGVTIAQPDTGSDAVNFTTYNIISQGMGPDQLKKAYFPERWISNCNSSINQSQAKLYFNGDFNGDGLTDVIALDQDVQELFCQPDPYGGPDEFIYSTNTTGQIYFVDLDRRKAVNFVNFAGTLQESFLSYDSKIETFDVNGDGKTDILHFKNGKVYVYDLDNNNQLRLLWQTPDLDIKISQSILPGDYNGDGKMDFIITKSFGQFAYDYIKYLSKGDGFVKIPQAYAFANMGTSEDTQAIYTCDLIPLDIDADGKTDIIQFRSIYGKPMNTGGTMVNVFKNTNSSFTATAIPTYQTTPSATFKSYPVPVFLSPKTNNQYLSVGVISDN
ncbi:FG-GAP-like repeat-containing protein [Flavobacterium sp. ASV13]|uniref:FG-GAP-like repeat-containing protein n=1 Tax=Flavobacterium sp. ASV13 TaxID=1506583 RepID=UPI0009DEECF9|nr:FG-GAP-like repeat-containing protein [Flavobacterium sp. ASV13]